MKKQSYLNKIVKLIPDDITLRDNTSFEFTHEESLVLLSWLKYFIRYYERNGMDRSSVYPSPVVSKRINLDFGLFDVPCDIGPDREKHVIYIRECETELKDLLNPSRW